MKIYIKKALFEYNELELKISNYTGSFEELCEELNGFNKDEKKFDVNYKSITTTIYIEDGVKILSKYIDIWNDRECCLIKEMFNIEEYEREVSK